MLCRVWFIYVKYWEIFDTHHKNSKYCSAYEKKSESSNKSSYRFFVCGAKGRSAVYHFAWQTYKIMMIISYLEEHSGETFARPQNTFSFFTVTIVMAEGCICI